MDTFLYEDIETGECPVCNLLLSKPKDELRIMANIDNVFNGAKGMASKFVKLCKGIRCHDGKNIFEITIKLPRNILVRIFFVYFDNIAILFDFLEKRHKPDYGKAEANEVDKKYVEKISNTAKFYKKYLKNKNCLKKINF